MKLRPIAQALPPVPVRFKLPGALHAGLSDYAEFYRHEHGASIDVPDLAVEMVHTFLAADREFRSSGTATGRSRYRVGVEGRGSDRQNEQGPAGKGSGRGTAEA